MESRTKQYIPLESNPEVFTHLLRTLGVPSLSFVDVYSLTDPDLLSFVPRPVHALVFIFPDVSTEWKEYFTKRESERDEYSGSGEAEEVIWFRQTIIHACGLFAILHSVSNGEPRAHIQPNSPLANLLEKVTPLPPAQRSKALEDDVDIEKAHYDAAIRGSSAVPGERESVNYRYVAFIKSKNGHLFEMDGGTKGPIDLGLIAEGSGDVLDAAKARVEEYVKREEGNVHFSLMALVDN